MLAHVKAALQAPIVNARCKLLLVALAGYANDAGACWPSVATLQRLVGFSEKRKVYGHLAALRDAGLLTWAERRGLVNRYQLTLEPVTVESPVTVGSPTGDRGVTPPVTVGSPRRYKEGTRKVHRAARGSGADGFDGFWAIYPKRVAKSAAMKAWGHLRLSPSDAARVLAVVKTKLAGPDWQKDGGRFIPHPATWLNGRRFDDEPAPPMAPAHDDALAADLARGARLFKAEQAARGVA